MTIRNRKLLDLAHEAPCMLKLAPATCGQFPSIPCHSDMQRHDRGVGHKSHDCMAVPGCPDCHTLFTRKLGRDQYEQIWLSAFEEYIVWLWENNLIQVTRR